MKSIKYRGQCTMSNQTNDNFEQISKEKTICRPHKPLQSVGKIGLNLTYC